MPLSSYTGFDGHQRIASGSLHTVAVAAKRAVDRGDSGTVLIFEDATGRSIDVELRGTEADVLARLPPSEATLPEPQSDVQTDARGRGRPKLGVVPREVTLLPRHWEWLATQPGGASVALRKLVDEARKTNADKDKRRHAHERAYRFMSAIDGNLPEFEEVTRALFANDQARFSEFAAAWPADVRDYAIQLAFGDNETT